MNFLLSALLLSSFVFLGEAFQPESLRQRSSVVSTWRQPEISPQTCFVSGRDSRTSLQLWPFEGSVVAAMTDVGGAFIGTTYVSKLFLDFGSVDSRVIEKNLPGFAFDIIKRFDKNGDLSTKAKDVAGLLLLDAIGYGVTYAAVKFVQVSQGWHDWTPAGLAVLGVAVTPYFLAVLLDGIFDGVFDLYVDPSVARGAEIGWKARFATLGLIMTSLTWGQLYVDPAVNVESLLHDFYIVWAFFYMDALWKIRQQDLEGELRINRNLIQAFHCLVAANLWAAANTDPLTFTLERFAVAYQSGMYLSQHGIF